MVFPSKYTELAVALNALTRLVLRYPLISRQLPIELKVFVVLVSNYLAHRFAKKLILSVKYLLEVGQPVVRLVEFHFQVELSE